MLDNKTMSRPLRVTLVVITILLSPLSLLTGLVVLSTVNPMGLAFLTSFTIDNKSGQDVLVSPIGAIGQDGKRRPLPFSCCKFLCVSSPKRTDFYIAKDTARTFVYDWDDIQFSEILVRSKQGDIRFIVTDPNPTQKQYRRLKNNLFIIPPLAELPIAPSNLESALAATGMQRIIFIYGLSTLGGIPPILTFILWRTRKKCSTRQDMVIKPFA
jgi:hypothetical protein